MYKLIVFLILGVFGFALSTLADSLRDPTQPPNVTSYINLKNNLNIEAIFFNKDDTNKSTVIIAGRGFTVGDKINKAVLIAVKSNEIVLKDDQGEFTIVMPYIPIKSQPTEINKNQIHDKFN